MLVLGRRSGQSLTITVGDQSFRMIFDLDASGEQVKVSIDADKSIVIMRSELLSKQDSGRKPAGRE